MHWSSVGEIKNPAVDWFPNRQVMFPDANSPPSTATVVDKCAGPLGGDSLFATHCSSFETQDKNNKHKSPNHGIRDVVRTHSFRTLVTTRLYGIENATKV